MAALKLQSRWRAHTAGRRGYDLLKQQQTPSHYYSDEMMDLRLKIYMLLEEPNSSFAARFLSIAILSIILLSIVAIVGETIPDFMPSIDNLGNRLTGDVHFVIEKSAWKFVDILCTVVFSMEFGLRAWTCNAPWSPLQDDKGEYTFPRFCKTPMNICDFAAITPLYFEIIFAGQGADFLRFLRIIRLVRLFRIFKLGRYSTALKLMFNAIMNSVQILFVLLFIMCKW